MDSMEKYKIQESVIDAIRILDSAPIKPDLVSETVIVQLTNRVPIAHLAIERALKALIAQGGGAKKYTHSLDSLYKALQESDEDSAKFLSEAFTDAVVFFGLDDRTKGFGHFRSLESYLSKVGGGKAFQALRYWPIENSPEGENPIPFVWLPIHREVLCALSCLFLRDSRETVSARVESEVARKLTEIREFSDIQDEESRKDSLTRYGNWITRNRGAFYSALKEAVHQDFVIKDEDKFVSLNLRCSYNELKQSRDPAIRYYISTCSYILKGSQRRNTNPSPKVEWLDKVRHRGFVNTPVGTELGFIEKYADGSWGITPSETGSLLVTETAETLEDAKHYLVNRLTCRLSFTVNGNPKELRIVGEPQIAGYADWTTDIDIQAKDTIKLKFWDNQHGLLLDDQVSFEFLPKRGTLNRLYEGSVTKVEDQRVTIVGTEVYT